MAKNLLIFCDGTGQKPEAQRDGAISASASRRHGNILKGAPASESDDATSVQPYPRTGRFPNSRHVQDTVAPATSGFIKTPNLGVHETGSRPSIAAADRTRIVPTPESCREIFHALLDHRLRSPLSLRMYDVPSTQLVG